MSEKQQRVRRRYTQKEREREEFQAAQTAAEVQKREPDMDRKESQSTERVTEELLEEIDTLLASEDAIDARSYTQKGGQ